MPAVISFLDKAVYAGVLAIVVAAPTQFSFPVLGGINLCLVDPLVWLVAAALGVRLLLERRLRTAAWPPLAAVLFVAWTALSAARAESRADAVKDLIQSAEYFLLAWFVFAEVLRDRERRMRVLQLFAAGAVAIVVLALMQYFSRGVEVSGVRGTFGNSSVLGGYLALTLPLLLGGALCGGAGWAGFALLAVVAGGLVATLSGGAFVGILAAAAGLCAARGRWAFVAYVAVAALGIALLWERLPRENLWVLHDSIAFYRRYPEWQAAAAMAAERPLLGVGAGNYQRHIGRYFGTIPCENVKGEADSQNLYLVLAGSLGVPGMLLFCGMLLASMRRAARVYACSDGVVTRAAALGTLGAIGAYAVAAVWAPLLVRGIGVPLAFMLALPFALAGDEPGHKKSGGGEAASAQ